MGPYFSSDFITSDKDIAGILPENFTDSTNNARITLLKGDGKCHFTDKSKLIPQTKMHGWFFDIGIQDIFQNGNQDIWISSDYGLNQVLKFESATTGWKDESELIAKALISRNGMGVVFSDIKHDKKSNIYASSIFQNREKLFGNQAWEYDKSKNEFIEFSHEQNIASCGWAWGAQFIDFNMDSWDDLAVVNGMFGDGTKKTYWYNLSVLDAAGREHMNNVKNWPSMDKFDLDGGQRDCLLLNQGRGKPFIDVTSLTVFDQDKKNGRGISYIDINNDGAYSLIVANQDDISHTYKVIPSNPYSWIGLSLSGFKNNSFAYGAKVYWKLSDGSESFKEMRPVQGFVSQNDPRFRLGFPINLSISELYIVWLDGKKQILDLNALKMNQYNAIVEKE